MGATNVVASVNVTDDQFVGSVTIDLTTLGKNFTATLNGAQEVPPIASPATGTGTFTIDTAAKTLTINTLDAAGFIGGPITGIHIHGSATPPTGAPGSNAPIVFDIGQAAGLTFPISNIVWNYATTPEMEAEILAGRTYVNIHTAIPGFATGEIRGQILPISNVQNMFTATPPPRTSAIWSVIIPGPLSTIGTFNLPIIASDGTNTASGVMTLSVVSPLTRVG